MTSIRRCSLLAVVLLIGCTDQSTRNRPEKESKQSTENLRREVLDAIRESEKLPSPDPTIALPDVSGWSRSKRRTLPKGDDGFSLAYEHRSGITVTLYQYSRGLPIIPDDLEASVVKQEMARVKSGIKDAIKLGYYESAREIDSGITNLGDSTQKALWSQHELTVRGKKVKSDSYVWVHANNFFKVRCSGLALDSKDGTTKLREFLTALGKACQTKAS